MKSAAFILENLLVTDSEILAIYNFKSFYTSKIIALKNYR